MIIEAIEIVELMPGILLTIPMDRERLNSTIWGAMSNEPEKMGDYYSSAILLLLVMIMASQEAINLLIPISIL